MFSWASYFYYISRCFINCVSSCIVISDYYNIVSPPPPRSCRQIPVAISTSIIFYFNFTRQCVEKRYKRDRDTEMCSKDNIAVTKDCCGCFGFSTAKRTSWKNGSRNLCPNTICHDTRDSDNLVIV